MGRGTQANDDNFQPQWVWLTTADGEAATFAMGDGTTATGGASTAIKFKYNSKWKCFYSL